MLDRRIPAAMPAKLNRPARPFDAREAFRVHK
jgi:hypothetical protein